MSKTILLLPLLSALSVGACGGERAAPPRAAPDSTPQAASVPVAGEAAATESEAPSTRIVVLGDSLTAGYGLDEGQAFPALVERRLRERGWRVDVVNGGVSGDTTAGGRTRLPWLLRQEPQVVVLALGANDALRGLPVDEAEENLREMIRLCRQSGAFVLLAGMKVPPNYGPDYSSGFEAIYPRLAAEEGVALMPFLLEDVGGRPDLNLADGIHPNPEGQRVIAAGLLPYVEELLAESERKGA